MKKNKKEFEKKLHSDWRKWKKENELLMKSEMAEIEKLEEGKEKELVKVKHTLNALKRFQAFLKKQEKIVQAFYEEPKKKKKVNKEVCTYNAYQRD